MEAQALIQPLRLGTSINCRGSPKKTKKKKKKDGPRLPALAQWLTAAAQVSAEVQV